MNARVTGSTYNGGIVVLVERENGEECEVEEHANGKLTCRFEIGHTPPSLSELLAIELAAREAIDNYGGPTDRQMDSFNAQCEAGQSWQDRSMF